MLWRRLFNPVFAVAVAIGATTPAAARAEEGMWPFESAPLSRINRDYGLSLDQAWLDRLRAASVRLAGCSGAIVSAEGLVLTNSHCVAMCLQDLAGEGEAELANGWTEGTREEERRCPAQTADVLVEVRDVTDEIDAAAGDKTGAELIQALYRSEAEISDAACAGDARFTCQVVYFYRGGRKVLYKYRTYRDVRLAFVPEPRIAGFGGDPDNFNFPRYSLDFAFLRLYEDGRPVQTPERLRWNPAAPRDGEATLVAGNPAWTQRQLTAAQLERLRDQSLPVTATQLAEMRGRLLQYSAGGPHQAEAAMTALSTAENNFKVMSNQLRALLDGSIIETRKAEEQALRDAVADNPDFAGMGDPWADIARAQTAARDLFHAYRQLEGAAGGGSTLYNYARSIVRTVQERAKPVEERRAGYTDATFAAIARKLAEPKPVEEDLEVIDLTFWLEKTREVLGVDDPAVRSLLGRENPAELAQRLVEGTELADPDVRAAYLAMTPDDLAKSGDPLIELVLANDTAAQLARTQWELAVEAPSARAQELIARARFAAWGDSQYPDATFTLRLSAGKVAGWTEGRRTIGPFTRIAGLYERATPSDPFRLPESWDEARADVDPQTVFAFVTTNDISGGNSGSPVVNGRGELIGTAFDGNIHSIAGSFAYDGRMNRTVALSTAVITEALREVYHQGQLLKELGQR